jgi:hypothetical protein
MADDKIVRLVRLLFEKTKAGEIGWEETSNLNIFQCSVSNYSILISRQTLTVCDEEGKIIEEVDGLAPLQEGVRLSELFELARRQAMGVERALDEILLLLEAGETKR